MRYVEIYGFDGRKNGGIARLTVFNEAKKIICGTENRKSQK